MKTACIGVLLICILMTVNRNDIVAAGPVSLEESSTGSGPCRFDNVPRPRVLITSERLNHLKEDIKTSSKRRKLYDEHVRSNADRWVNRPITIPDQGGWAHDFSCVDGTMLELPEEQRFESDAPARCPACGKTYLTPKITSARHYFEHNWLTFSVRDLALVWAIEGKRSYAEKAAEILLKYADAYTTLSAGKSFGFQSLSLTEAVNQVPLAQGYDLIFDSGVLSDADKETIRRRLFWPAAQRLINSGGLRGNWGSWHLSAVGVIGYATGHQRFADYGVDSFKYQIKNVLPDDGLWPESVHTYHFYPLDGFLALTEAAFNCGVDLYTWEAKPGKGLKLMFDAPLRYMYPTLQLPAINDGWYNAWLPQDQYTLAYYRYKDQDLAWSLRRSEEVRRSGAEGDFYDQHYRMFLFGERLPEAIKAPVFNSINFPGLGIGILRQGSARPVDQEMFVTFDYGRHLGHGQPDKMGVTLFACGRALAPDYGTCGYGSSILPFYKGTTSHNTIAVDGNNQPPTTDSQLLLFRETPAVRVAVARTDQIATNTEWTRAVAMTDDYVVIFDNLVSDQEHQYDWFFHAETTNLMVDGEPRGYSGKSADSEIPYPFLSDVKKHAAGSLNAEWVFDDATRLSLAAACEQESQLFSAHCPSTATTTASLVILRNRAHSCFITAVLQPKGENPTKIAATISRNSDDVHVLEVRQGAKSDIYTFSRNRFQLTRTLPEASASSLMDESLEGMGP